MAKYRASSAQCPPDRRGTRKWTNSLSIVDIFARTAVYIMSLIVNTEHITYSQGWKMALKKTRFLLILNLKKHQKSEFRFLGFLYFGEILCKSYLISYFNLDL